MYPFPLLPWLSGSSPLFNPRHSVSPFSLPLNTRTLTYSETLLKTGMTP